MFAGKYFLILLHAGMYLPNPMNNCIDALECNAVLQIFVPSYCSGTGKSASVGIAVQKYLSQEFPA